MDHTHIECSAKIRKHKSNLKAAIRSWDWTTHIGRSWMDEIVAGAASFRFPGTEAERDRQCSKLRICTPQIKYLNEQRSQRMKQHNLLG